MGLLLQKMLEIKFQYLIKQFIKCFNGARYKTWDYNLIILNHKINYNAEIKEDFKKAIITPKKVLLS
jgi:hypothetical protein